MPSGTSEYMFRRNNSDQWEVYDTSSPPEGYGYVAVDANGVAYTQLTYYGARKRMSMLNAVDAATRAWTSP